MSLEDRASSLYGLPLAEFTAARNDLAKELRSAGEREASDEVKRLAKPSISAWAVNQLYRERRQSFDDLLAAGRAQRKAVRTGADQLRAAAERKRKLQSELLKAAEKILAREGTRLSPTLRLRISRTLDVLAAWPPKGEKPPLGRLTADLEPTGFDALLGAQIAATTRKPGARTSKGLPAKPKRATARERRRRKEASAAVDLERRELAALEKAAKAAKATLTRAESLARRTLEKAQQTERAAEEARARADAAGLALRKARAERDRATQAAERQEASLDTALRKLAELG